MAGKVIIFRPGLLKARRCGIARAYSMVQEGQRTTRDDFNTSCASKRGAEWIMNNECISHAQES